MDDMSMNAMVGNKSGNKGFKPLVSEGSEISEASDVLENITDSEEIYHITWVTHNSRISERMRLYKVKIGEPIIFSDEDKKVVKVKKVVKAVPDRVVDKKEVTEGTIPEKKKTGTIKKKVSKTKNDTSRGIEEKVKAIEETMSRSLEEKFIKLDKEKMIKKIIKKKIES